MLDTSKSLSMQTLARKRIPGMTQLLSKRPDRFAPGVWPGYYQRAKGAHVWDLDGNRYLDMSIGGIGANVLGYADDEVDNAVRQAISDGSSSSLNCPEEVTLAELLCNIHPWADMVRYARGGGEAMAVAVRIARAATGKDLIIVCGYHGWHDWYLAANLASAHALDHQLIANLEPVGVPACLAGTVYPFHYNRIDELEALLERHGSQLAAIVMEPIRNCQPSPGFLEDVADMARRCGAVLVFDEVSAAFRMNSGGAHLTLGVAPDVAVFAKAMANGYPMAAVIGRAAVMRAASQSFISSTNWTERIGPTAALATIRKHQRESVGDHLVQIGKAVQNGLEEIGMRRGVPISIDGIPPLTHISFDVVAPLHARAFFVERMIDYGILAGGSFYPMYAHTAADVSRYLEAADVVLSEMATAVEAGDLIERLQGGPAQAGFGRLA